MNTHRFLLLPAVSILTALTLGSGVGHALGADYPSAVVADGPLAYYRLSETAAPVPDVATNSGSLGAAGNGVYTTGAGHQVAGAIVGDSDTAATFTAVDTNSDDGGVPVVVPFAADFNPAGSFTIEAWLRPTEDGNGNAQCPMFNRDPADTSPDRVGWDFFQRSSGTGWNFRMFNGNGHTRVFDVTGGPYTVGQWCHLVAVYDASVPSVALYLNGQPVAASSSPNGTFNVNTSFPLSVGGYSDGSQNPFVGDIDEVAIYASALTANQVAAHYQNGTNSARAVAYSALVTSDGAVEYLRLDEPAQNVASNNGTLAIGADGVYGAYAQPGQAGPEAPAEAGFEATNVATYFDGSTGYIELGNPGALNFPGPITLEAWISPSTTPASSGGFGDIIAHGYADDYYETSLRVDDSTGTPAYSVGNNVPAGGHGAEYAVPAADLAGGVWVHLVGTFDGTNWNLYRNGLPVARGADTAGAIVVSNANWAIGARGRWKTMDALTPVLDRQFQGTVDEPAIYNYALTPAQVLKHYLVGTLDATNAAPIIYAQPVSITVHSGYNATFAVGAASTTALTYQWYEGTTLLADMTNATLVVSNAQPADAGDYSVAVSNLAGTTNSAVAALTFSTPSTYASLVLAGNPLAFYPLDETNGTTAFDDSGNGNNGTYQNTPTLGTAGPSSLIPLAASFDGGSQWVDLGNPGILNFTGPITLEAWIQPTSSELSLADVLGHGYDSVSGHETTLRLDGDSSYYVGAYPGYNLSAGNPGGEAGEWVHLVGTYDGEDWNLYTNGVLAGSTPAPASGALDAQTDWAIANGTGLSAGRYYQGPVCQVALYDHALTPAQVQEHYTVALKGTNIAPIIAAQSGAPTNYAGAALSVSVFTYLPAQYQWLSNGVPLPGATNATYLMPATAVGLAVDYSVVVTNIIGSAMADFGVVQTLPTGFYAAAVMADGPVAFYPLNETNGTMAYDYAGGHDGTYVNAPVQGDAGPSIYAPLAVDFDGSSQWVDLGDPAALNFNGPITMEVWIKPSATELSLADVLGHGYDGAHETALRLDGDNSYYVGSYPGYNLTGGNPGGSAGQWVHLVGTCDGSTWNLYTNGVLAGSTAAPGSGALTATSDWAVANGTYGSYGRYFQGSITQVAFYDYALTSAQVHQHYAVGINGPTLSTSLSGQSLTLTWSGTGTLQQATNVAGPFTEVSGVVSPFTVTATNAMTFYRLQQ